MLNNNLRLVQRAVFSIAALAFSASASAQWSLDLDNSQLSFVTVKAEHIAEVHSFSRLEGQIDAAGNARISIDLSSVETGIAIRNERMQSMLFETGLYPQAAVSAAINTDALSAIAVGEEIARLYPNADAKQQARFAAKLLSEIKPAIDDAIVDAGGTGWRKYLQTYETGMK
ncbi:MAG: YceI family protein, partial [OM182 bacterium]|nr:YceI family protein [OM182 bacterium]